MPNGIWDRDTYITTTDEKTLRKMTFDMLKALHDGREKDEKRFKALENRKWKDKGIAGGAGIIGGFIASFFKS